MNASQALIASRKRAAHPEFVSTFSLGALQARLPLRFAATEGVRICVKGRYRSQYRYLGNADLTGPNPLADLTLFEVALCLIDFSPVHDYLAVAYYTGSARGQVPFGPVSLFLCVCPQRELGCGWHAWLSCWPASTAPAGGATLASRRATHPAGRNKYADLPSPPDPPGRNVYGCGVNAWPSLRRVSSARSHVLRMMKWWANLACRHSPIGLAVATWDKLVWRCAMIGRAKGWAPRSASHD